MSLSRKVSIFVILTFLVSGVLSFAIQQIFILPSFITLEKESAIQNAERVVGAIDRELGQITDFVTDWSHWTDSYKYAKGQHQEYQAVNLDLDNTLIAMKMNFLGYYDTTGKTLWSKAEDLESGDPVDLGQLTGAGLPANHPLLQHRELMSDIRGIIPTLHGPLLVVAGPILTSDEEGPIAGTLMMGRFLDDTAIEQIADLTKLSIVVKTAGQQKKTVSLLQTANTNNGLVYTELEMVETPETWQMHTTIKDIFNNPILALQIDTPRDISAQGVKAVKQSLWVLAATGMLVMLILWTLLQQAVLKPIAKLTEHALIIGRNDNFTARLNLPRKDEVGILAQTFDQMVDRLAETRRHLVDQSYHSGIAEMASGVLHNIGNALTPLNVRLTMLQQDLRAAPLAELEQAAAELADPSTPPERRADLKEFVKLVGNELAKVIKNGQEKVEASIQQIGQVQEILVDQQRYSRSARVIEPVDMVTIIKDVEAGLSPDIKDTIQIEIAPDVAEISTVSGSRAALQQIVTNLLINAAESIQAAATVPGHITVTAERQELQGQPMVGFHFTDNGAGIDPDHLGRLFEQGFSTKNREGSGYGLHWSSNTLHALGGRITTESGGIGSGACVSILLPAREDYTQQTSDTLKDHDGLQN